MLSLPTRRSIGDGPNAMPAERKEGAARRELANDIASVPYLVVIETQLCVYIAAYVDAVNLNCDRDAKYDDSDASAGSEGHAVMEGYGSRG